MYPKCNKFICTGSENFDSAKFTSAIHIHKIHCKFCISTHNCIQKFHLINSFTLQTQQHYITVAVRKYHERVAHSEYNRVATDLYLFQMNGKILIKSTKEKKMIVATNNG